MLAIFNHIALYDFWDILMGCGILALSVFSYTTLMDRNMHAIWLEALKLVLAFAMMDKMGGWFGIDVFLPYSNYIVGGYFVVSFLMTTYFILFDIGKDKAFNVPTIQVAV